jgi:hypothetical protein
MLLKNIIGTEKNNDRNKGITINERGIKNFSEGSKVNELDIQ